MDNRRINMQRYNAVRSARVEAMIEFLKDIDFGGTELCQLGIRDGYRLEREVNSYRAMLIARYFRVNISKGKLTQFSKPKDHRYNFTAAELMGYISDHHDQLMNYWEWFVQPAIRRAREKYPTEEEIKKK